MSENTEKQDMEQNGFRMEERQTGEGKTEERQAGERQTGEKRTGEWMDFENEKEKSGGGSFEFVKESFLAF